jgi:AraC-like DNA-binding protein
MLLTSPQYGHIALTPINSENLPGPILPGSNTFFHENDFGTILIHQYNAENFSLRFTIFNLIKKVSFFIKEESAMLKSHVILKGSHPIKVNKKSKAQIREGQYVVFKDKDELTVFFESAKEYQIFDASFSDALLQRLYDAFPSLKDFIANKAARNVVKSYDDSRSASHEMTRIVYELLRCPYDENLRKLYFENKVNDFLFEMLVESSKADTSANKLTQKENDSLFKARDIIKADITKHFSIKEISQKVQLNEFKLKSGFKQVLGTGIFEYLIKIRMENAYQLLTETNKPIKEIASLSGFDYLTNFITAFSKHFGYTPGSLKRKKNN